jgi:hypothetical protein
VLLHSMEKNRFGLARKVQIILFLHSTLGYKNSQT